MAIKISKNRIDLDAKPIKNIQYDEYVHQAADPTAPAAGFLRFYEKSDGLYVRNSAGTVSQVSIGNTGEAWITDQTPTPSPDSTTTAFTVTTNTKIVVYKNGLRKKPAGSDYTRTNATTITFVTAPTTGDVILYDYVA